MNLLVTATLANDLVGDAPHLDGLLECVRARPEGFSHETNRTGPAPPIGAIPIPLLRREIGGYLIGKCSSPILPSIQWEGVEHFGKQFDTSKAELLHPQERTSHNSGVGVLKSYRLPMRTRVIDRVCWFAVAERRELIRTLRRFVPSLGHKRAHGHGIVASWEAVQVDGDYTWFADGVLMRPLPIEVVPKGTKGAVREWAACQPPYWHPGRVIEAMCPC